MTSPVLPHANLGSLFGLVDAMAGSPGPDDLFRLAAGLRIHLDELVPLLEAAKLLGWARFGAGDYDLTEEGRRVAEAQLPERKDLFRARVRTLPIFEAVLRGLSRHRRLARERVLAPLRESLGPLEAERQIDTAINWGRWAELFDYEADEAVFLRASPRQVP